MKDTQSILQNLTSKAHFAPLKQHKCYRIFLSLLPPRFQKAIAFVTVKNSQLLIGLKHPGYKMELNYNQELLRGLLTMVKNSHQECNFLEAKKIIIFQSRYHKPNTQTNDTIPYYRELAKGEFKVDIKNRELKEIFEEIREYILKNRRKF